MKNKTFAVIIIGMAFSTLNAQKKYEKIVYQDVTYEGSDIKVTAKDIVSNKEMTKFQYRIENKTDKLIMFRPEESSIRLSGGKEIKPNEKPLIIHQGASDYRTVNVKGPDFLTPEYSYNVEGFYIFSDKETAVETPEFTLPPSRNDFKAGNFSCSMTDLKKETAKTTVKFECRYTGDDIGVINPGRAAIKLPDGTEIANAKSNAKSQVLLKGDTEKITLTWDRMEGGKATDMQLIKMQILWRDTFVESEEEKMKPVSLTMKIDESKSK
jgi:hypothetical protein